jgi:putative membrane protein
MKKLYIIPVIVLTACALQACKYLGKDSDQTNVDTTGIVTDTTTKFTVAVDKEDSTFAAEAVKGNMTEVQLGNLAIKNGQSKQVKNFGAMMVKDHGKADMKLSAIAQSKKLKLPVAIDTAEQKILNNLSKKTGAAFDKAYISMMISDHQDDIKEFEAASQKVQDPDLQKFAIKTLPVLQKHLDAINAIHDSMHL